MEDIKSTILIVDDNSINNQLLEATIKPLGCNTLIYTSPQKALVELSNTYVDIVLIDIVMPELDGFTFAEKFLLNHPNTTIIFISAHNEIENRLRCFSMGACVFIEKPFDVKATRAQIASILKLKKLQDQLLREKEKLDCILEYSSNEIILTDKNFNIINQNNKIIHSNNDNSNNFINILKYYKQEDSANTLLNFSESQDTKISFNFIIDNTQYIKATISKTFSKNVLNGYLLILDDITEEHEIEKQREQFIETLTHDLKTPVRAEKRALELLYEGSFGELTKEQKGIIKEILNSSHYMMRMTNNVLTKYKLDNGKYKIFKRQYSIKQTIQDCLDSLKYLFESKNQTIKITSNIDNDLCEYDEREIKRVLTNIIANASEYSPKDSTIEIILEKGSKSLKLSIKDEGSGIPKETLETIFEENMALKSRFKKVGSGVGLYITKKIMEAHNGDIKVESKENQGSIFTLSIPIEKECTLSTK